MIGRAPLRGAALALVVAGAIAAGGCGGGSDDAAADDTTEAAAATAAATTAEAATTAAAPATTATAPLRAGTAAAGKVAFEAAPCSGCHAGLGTRAGYGPKLAGRGLTPAQIRTAVIEGPGQMPAGQAEGQELADIVAYVATLQ